MLIFVGFLTLGDVHINSLQLRLLADLRIRTLSACSWDSHQVVRVQTYELDFPSSSRTWCCAFCYTTVATSSWLNESLNYLLTRHATDTEVFPPTEVGMSCTWTLLLQDRQGTMRLHTVVCVCSSDSDALFLPHIVWQLWWASVCAQRQFWGRAIWKFWQMRAEWIKQNRWQYLLISKLWPDGSKAMAGCASLIAISSSVGPTQSCWPSFVFFLFSFLHHHASGFQVGFLFPVVTGCRLWAKKQYSFQRARKKLHVAIPTAYYARELLITPVFKKVCLPPSL